MEFIITPHAYKRLKQRVRVSDRKVQALVKKAWETKDVYIRKVRKAEYNMEHKLQKDRIIRELMGYVFVFEKTKNGNEERKKLITVF